MTILCKKQNDKHFTSKWKQAKRKDDGDSDEHNPDDTKGEEEEEEGDGWLVRLVGVNYKWHLQRISIYFRFLL